MNKVTTLSQLQTLQNETMIYALVVVLAAILLAFLISLIIPYQGGIDRSYIKRRIAYIIIGITACLGYYLYNDLVVKGSIVNVGFKNMFVSTNLQCLGITVGGYILTGIILMIAFRDSKFGSILGKKRDK